MYYDTLLNKYKRLKVEDNAKALFDEEVRAINQVFFDSTSKKPKQSDNEAYNEKIKEAYKRLERDSFIKNMDLRKKGQKQRINRFLLNHKNANNLQDYINYIEASTALADNYTFFAELPSDTRQEFYEIGRKKGLSTKEIIEKVSREYERILTHKRTYTVSTILQKLRDKL